MKCVFCDRIKRGEYDEKIGNAVVFEPLNPVVPGHRLILPIKHVQNAADDSLTVALTFKAASEYSARQTEPFNLITSAGAAATQSILHLHVHYVPRKEGDGLHLPWTGQVKS